MAEKQVTAPVSWHVYPDELRVYDGGKLVATIKRQSFIRLLRALADELDRL